MNFKVEIDPTGNGEWMTYDTYNVKSGETLTYEFPKGLQARWIRFSVDKDTEVSALLDYK